MHAPIMLYLMLSMLPKQQASGNGAGRHNHFCPMCRIRQQPQFINTYHSRSESSSAPITADRAGQGSVASREEEDRPARALFLLAPLRGFAGRGRARRAWRTAGRGRQRARRKTARRSWFRVCQADRHLANMAVPQGFCQGNENAKPTCKTVGYDVFRLFGKSKNGKRLELLTSKNFIG